LGDSELADSTEQERRLLDSPEFGVARFAKLDKRQHSNVMEGWTRRGEEAVEIRMHASVRLVPDLNERSISVVTRLNISYRTIRKDAINM